MPVTYHPLGFSLLRAFAPPVLFQWKALTGSICSQRPIAF